MDEKTYPLESLELYRWPQRGYILKVKGINSLTTTDMTMSVNG